MSEQAPRALTSARLGKKSSQVMLDTVITPRLSGPNGEVRMFDAFMRVDLAHVTMLTECGIIPAAAGRDLLGGLLALREAGPSAISLDAALGTLLLQIENFLTRSVGQDASGVLQLARSRIDQGATARRLYKRDGLLQVLGKLLTLQDILLEVAARHTRTIMPGYTHMQHAQPWIFGHYLLSFVSRLRDDFERASETYARVNRNPLGTVGLSGTSWPINRVRTTELLGFAGLVENSKLGREAYYAAEIAATLSFIMCDLNDLATDFHVWSTSEFGLVASHDAYCSTSSIFPQKKNPAALESVKAATAEAVTWLATALATFRAEGTGDQAIRSVPLLDGAFESTSGMLDLMGGIVSTLVVHEDRMKAALADSWCTSSALADLLVREAGLSFRGAHHVVARLVRICTEEKVHRDLVSSELLARAGQETLGRAVMMATAQIHAALDPENFVRTRQSTGGIAPEQVDRMLSEARTNVAADQAWLAEEKTRLATANAKLESAVIQISEFSAMPS